VLRLKHIVVIPTTLASLHLQDGPRILPVSVLGELPLILPPTPFIPRIVYSSPTGSLDQYPDARVIFLFSAGAFCFGTVVGLVKRLPFRSVQFPFPPWRMVRSFS